MTSSTQEATTVRRPAVDDQVRFGDLPGQTFRIVAVHAVSAFADGWGYRVHACATGPGFHTTLLEAEHGPTGWEYLR
jgi:hypothetical protein